MTTTDTASPRALRSHIAGLREGTHTGAKYVSELCDRIDRVDPRVRALVDEPGRRGRLRWHPNWVTWVRVGVSYLTPFVVASLGYPAG